MRNRYKLLVDQFATDIRHGRLVAGDRLPTHRALARQHHISLATASRVYAELMAIGLIQGETGRGTFVRDISLPPGMGVDQQEIASDIVDLSFNYPMLEQQTPWLRQALRQLSDSSDLAALLRYQPHAGRLADRQAIADWVQEAGVKASAEDVLIVNGAQHGLNIILMSLLQPGDVIAADTVTYPGFKALARLCHLEVVPIPVTQRGPDLSTLQLLCRQRRVKALYCMPTLHNPLGWVLTTSQRKALAAIGRQHDLLLIEDAAYARLVKKPPAPLCRFAPERTLYISGFSKNIATGLRVGVVVAPACYRPQLERAIRATSWNTPALLTSLIRGWLQDGTVQRLEAMKRQDARKRQALARQILGDLNPTGHPDAYFLWIPLPGEIRASRVASRLAGMNIAVSTAEPFSVTGSPPDALRIALGSVGLPVLETALLQVREAIEYFRDL